MKRLRRVVSLMLAFAFILITVGRTAIATNAADNNGTVVYDENGTKYVIKTFVYDDCRKVVVQNCDSLDKTEIIVNNDFENAQLINYDYIGKNVFGIYKYKKEVICYNSNDYIDDINKVTSQYSWSSKRYDCKNEFWYQKGASDYGNEYLQIGCKAKYRIAYWKLSNSKQKNCDKYVKAVSDSNKYYAAVIALPSGSLFLGGAGWGLLGGISVALPPVAVIAAIGGAFSVGTLTATCIYKTIVALQDAEDYYAIIKKYGDEI